MIFKSKTSKCSLEVCIYFLWSPTEAAYIIYEYNGWVVRSEIIDDFGTSTGPFGGCRFYEDCSWYVGGTQNLICCFMIDG